MADGNALTITIQAHKGDTLLLSTEFSGEDSITIGSGPDAKFSVTDESVAALHAVLNIEGGAVQLADCGAGVVVGGENVSNTTLATGGQFNLGDVTLTVTFDAPVASVPDVEAETDPGASGHLEAPTITTETTQDVMEFVLSSSSKKSSLGNAQKGPKVLEVNQVWETIVLDTKHFGPGKRQITIGSQTGHRWSVGGIDLGWVPSPLNMVLPFAPPMLSEVETKYYNDFYVSDEGLPAKNKHDLFSWSGSSYVANIADGWGGFAEVGGQRASFDELVAQGKASKGGGGYQIPIDDDIRVIIDIDGTVFTGQRVPGGKRVKTPLLDMIDFLFLGILALTAFLGLLFLLVVLFAPRSPDAGFTKLDERFVDMLLEQQEKDKDKDNKPEANPDAGEGAKAKREEGKVGKKDAKMQKAKGDKIEKTQMDKQIAEDAGVLGALRDGGMMDGFGGQMNADMLGGVGGLIGAKGVQVGAGGLGSRGSGLGGGGTADGLGGLGTKGMGSGASGYGRGGGNFGAKGTGAIGAVGGDPIILGALDRSLIDRVIKRHMAQIRYCYQRQLTKNPSLKGKIVIKFVIAKDGSVSSASKKTSSMNSPPVESCIVGRFMRMKFPEPKGGGIVIVSYPFIFSAG